MFFEDELQRGDARQGGSKSLGVMPVLPTLKHHLQKPLQAMWAPLLVDVHDTRAQPLFEVHLPGEQDPGMQLTGVAAAASATEAQQQQGGGAGGEMQGACEDLGTPGYGTDLLAMEAVPAWAPVPVGAGMHLIGSHARGVAPSASPVLPQAHWGTAATRRHVRAQAAQPMALQAAISCVQRPGNSTRWQPAVQSMQEVAPMAQVPALATTAGFTQPSSPASARPKANGAAGVKPGANNRGGQGQEQSEDVVVVFQHAPVRATRVRGFRPATASGTLTASTASGRNVGASPAPASPASSSHTSVPRSPGHTVASAGSSTNLPQQDKGQLKVQEAQGMPGQGALVGALGMRGSMAEAVQGLMAQMDSKGRRRSPSCAASGPPSRANMSSTPAVRWPSPTATGPGSGTEGASSTGRTLSRPMTAASAVAGVTAGFQGLGLRSPGGDSSSSPAAGMARSRPCSALRSSAPLPGSPGHAGFANAAGNPVSPSYQQHRVSLASALVHQHQVFKKDPQQAGPGAGRSSPRSASWFREALLEFESPAVAMWAAQGDGLVGADLYPE